MSSIGCEKRYEEILQNDDIFKEFPNIISNLIITLLILLLITIFIFCCCKKIFSVESFFGEVNSKEYEYFNSILSRMLVGIGITFILIILCFSGFVYSLIILSNGSFFSMWSSDKKFIEKYNLYSIVILFIFYFFLLNYYCLITAKNINVIAVIYVV